MTKSCTITEAMANRIANWYPWITNLNSNVLDMNLNTKIESGDYNLTMSEALTALRWYSNLPFSFKLVEDDAVATFLHCAINLCILEEDV